MPHPLITRFAPSPTGHLHLGHVVHAMWVWGVAQVTQAEIKFRIEDHDRSRCKLEFESSIIEDMIWLGFKTANEIVWRQSDHSNLYQEQFQKLVAAGLIYACSCSRSEIARATGRSEGELRYPGTCRNKELPLDAPDTALRLKIPSDMMSAMDLLQGDLKDDPALSCGDIVIRDRQGSWTYQFCVVIDDLEQGVNLIIRGQDLLSSTSRQLALRQILSPGSNQPQFLHHPLLSYGDGHKLSKRIGSQAISTLRGEGWTPERVLGHAAFLGGLLRSDGNLSIHDIHSIIPAHILRALLETV